MTDKADQPTLKAAILNKKRETYTPLVPDEQFGFIHNNVDCIGCRACEIACKAVSYTHLDVYKRQILRRGVLRCSAQV